MPAALVTAPIDRYVDPDIFDRERRAIFAKTWQFLGLEADLVRAGDYLADVLAGFPVMVVRDEQGVLRGYHNVCRHRAGPLVAEGTGHCRGAIVCRFHEWRYGFDGQLREATGFGAGDGLDLGIFNLLPIQVETWHGLVFVNLDNGSARLGPMLAPLERRFSGGRYRPARMRDRHPIGCNWKVYIENYLDGYLRRDIHTGRSVQPGSLSHRVQREGDVVFYELADSRTAAEGLWAWAWPNFGLTVYRNILLLEHTRPEAADRTTVDHIFLHEPEDPGVDAAIVTFEDVTEEDCWICERVQQNLRAGIYRQGVLSQEYETAVAWFQNRVDQALAP